MLHAHVTSWSLALLLFVISLILHYSGKQKGARTAAMILRGVYLLAIATGAGLVVKYGMIPDALIKGALALVLIGLMDLILTSTRLNRKGGLLAVAWLLFVVDIVGVFYYGYVVFGE